MVEGLEGVDWVGWKKGVAMIMKRDSLLERVIELMMVICFLDFWRVKTGEITVLY